MYNYIFTTILTLATLSLAVKGDCFYPEPTFSGRPEGYSNRDIFTVNSINGFMYWTVVNSTHANFGMQLQMPSNFTTGYVALATKQGTIGMINTDIWWSRTDGLQWDTWYGFGAGDPLYPDTGYSPSGQDNLAWYPGAQRIGFGLGGIKYFTDEFSRPFNTGDTLYDHIINPLLPTYFSLVGHSTRLLGKHKYFSTGHYITLGNISLPCYIRQTNGTCPQSSISTAQSGVSTTQSGFPTTAQSGFSTTSTTSQAQSGFPTTSTTSQAQSGFSTTSTTSQTGFSTTSTTSQTGFSTTSTTSTAQSGFSTTSKAQSGFSTTAQSGFSTIVVSRTGPSQTTSATVSIQSFTTPRSTSSSTTIHLSSSPTDKMGLTIVWIIFIVILTLCGAGAFALYFCKGNTNNDQNAEMSLQAVAFNEPLSAMANSDDEVSLSVGDAKEEISDEDGVSVSVEGN